MLTQIPLELVLPNPLKHEGLQIDVFYTPKSQKYYKAPKSRSLKVMVSYILFSSLIHPESNLLLLFQPVIYAIMNL